MRNISAWSIRNPVIPLVLFAGLLFAGFLSFSRMSVQNNPDIEFGVVVVAITQPGAAPSEIYTQITEKVESAVTSVEGVDVISSEATEGSSVTQINMEIGEDVNVAVNEVKAAVDQIRGDLPDGILEPRVFKVATSSNDIVNFAVTADDMTMEQLSWFTDDVVTKRLQAVPGVAAASRRGGVDREIRVMLDPARMQALGVSAAQINAALRQSNVDAGGGEAEIAGSRQSVRVLGNAESAYNLSQQQISLGGGRSIKLSDVATVTDGASEIRSIAKVDGRPVVTFGIQRARGESDVSVYDASVKVLEEIKRENPGIEFTELFNSVTYTKDQYESSMAAMIEGAILAVVVVFFFLRDWRATIISAIAIPLSAIPTFWFMDMLGFTLNEMSLLALGLVAGVLVDDAIVEIENIVRHMRMGKTAYQASIDAADEIGIAVVATTFSIAAVFLPVGLMPGIAGQFFKNFGLTVVAAVLMSLAVARMITPLIAAYFLKEHGQAEHASGPWMQRYMRVLDWTIDHRQARRLAAAKPRVPGRRAYLIPAIAMAVIAFAVPFVGATRVPEGATEAPGIGGLTVLTALLGALAGFAIGWLVTVFLTALAGVITRQERSGLTGWGRSWLWRMRARFADHRVWIMGVGLISFILTIVMFATTPMQFFPNTNLDFSMVRIEMVPGTTLEQTEETSDKVVALLREEQEVENVLQNVSEGSGSLYVTLRDDRVRKSQQFEREVAIKFQDIPDARVNFQQMQNGPPGGSGRDISVMLSGSDPALLERTAQALVEEMKGLASIRAPRIEAALQRPELIITPRADLAASLGVNTASLSQAIRIATIGEIDQNAARFSLSDRQVPIRVMLPEQSRSALSTIQNLPVPTASGGSVPLSRVADIRFGAGPTAIESYDRLRRVYIGADLAPKVDKAVADEQIAKLPLMQNLPTGVANTKAGSDRFLQELLVDFAVALGTGILSVFAVLVLLYRRLMSPLVNMGSLLLAPLGGLIALKLLGQPISLPVFIGILMLFGIVAKNSILLVDFALEEMERGKSRFEAIVEAGRKRAQPIVMTTVAMTAGMIPTAMSLSGDGAWRAPMGTVVIGGLILATLLTLVIVPAGFSLASGIERRLGPKLRRTFLSYDPQRDGSRDPAPGMGGAALPAE
ncbi:efflux RND transporter permease subunit [Qipengyuania sediminis]|uniref:efflux RND transporter permease subunit n=1 Tax=Qipengyuania sediminis TaxID=1532023 RepID=UPI00105A6163|nr:efflux RND transporter permease subunit [Qipengyuania sediminis]